jgi:Fe2+ transport system protein FeoA
MKVDSRMRLDLHRPGVAARILAVEAEPGDQDRLECLGLCVGRTVEVVQAGDPMIVRVLGTRIGIAAVLAAAVLIEPGVGG